MTTFHSLKEHYLVCDADCPILSSGSLEDEMLLYNLKDTDKPHLTQMFKLITEKELNLASKTEELSGGQKVILMCLLALYSPASSIAFLNLDKSLDTKRRSMIRELVAELGAGKEIILRETDEA